MESRIKKVLDNLAFGLIISIVIPAIVYFIRYHQEIKVLQTLAETVNGVDFTRKLLSPILMICILVDAPLFFLFYWLKMDKAAKGLLIFAAFTTLVMLVYNLYPHLT